MINMLFWIALSKFYYKLRNDGTLKEQGNNSNRKLSLHKDFKQDLDVRCNKIKHKEQGELLSDADDTAYTQKSNFLSTSRPYENGKITTKSGFRGDRKSTTYEFHII